MKTSKYNICLPIKDKHIIFNGVTKRFFIVSNQNKEAFLQILSDPDEYTDSYGPFLQRMKDEGFIVDNSTDEIKIIQQQYEHLKKSDTYKLMILPTYACNVNCWYCTQHHRGIQLKDEDVEKIKKHIVNYINSHQDIKNVELAWFGGEPLLNFHRIIEIASFAKTFCMEHHINIYNTITTNGILLNKEKLEEMTSLNFTFFQITVDGIQEEHDKIKVIKGQSAYAMTLRNICLIAESLPNAEISLRYNYTKENLNPKRFISDLNKFIPQRIRSRIELSLMKVWQEDEEKLNNELISQLAYMAKHYGYQVDVGPEFGICYVEKQHFNCIFPNGRVDKCDNDDPELCRGDISDDGEIKWKENISFLDKTIFNTDSDCLQCKYLPICYGPCPRERDRKNSLVSKWTCRYGNNPSKVLDLNILHYCLRFLSVLFLFLPLHAVAQNNDSLSTKQDSVLKNVNLQEVVIEANNVVHHRDKDVWIITDEMRKQTFNTYDIICRIPNVYYDKMNRQLYYKNHSGVLLQIDGKVKSNEYIGNLANIRFWKIEIIKHPTGHFRDYYAIINVITKENWEGYEVDVINTEQMKPGAEYENFFTATRPEISCVYSRPAFNVALHYDYQNFNEHKNSSLTKRWYDDGLVSINTQSPTEWRDNNRHNVWGDADYDINKNHSLSLKFNYKSICDYSGKSYLMNSTTLQDYQRQSNGNTNDKNYIFSIFYYGKVGKIKIYSDFTYNLQRGTSFYDYREAEIYTTTSNQNNNRSFTDFKIEASTRLKKYATVSLGYQNYNRWTQSRTVSNQSSTGLYRHKGYLSGAISLTDNMSLNLLGGVDIFRKTSSTTKEKTYVLWEWKAIWDLGLHDGKYNMSIKYDANVSYPMVYQLNPIQTRLDSILIVSGNPQLKPTTQHNASIDFDFGFIDLNSSIDYSDNMISSVYKERVNDILLTYDNIKSINWQVSLSLFKRLKIAKRTTIQCAAHVDYNRCRIWGDATDRRHTYLTGGFYAYLYSNFISGTIEYRRVSCHKLTASTDVLSGDDKWEVSITKGFLKKRLNIDLIYRLPFKFGINRYFIEHTKTPVYENLYSYDNYHHMQNTILLKVSLRFAGGHQIKKRKNIQKEEVEEIYYND